MSRFFQTALITRTLVLAAAVSTITMPQRANAQGPSDGLAVRDVFHLSSNLVEVRCSDEDFPHVDCRLISPNGAEGASAYVVPAKMNFVITSVQINPVELHPVEQGITGLHIGLFVPIGRGFILREQWFVQPNVTNMFQYPHGIVISPGASMQAALFPDINGVASKNAQFVVVLRGYLSPAVVVTGPLPN